MSRIQGFLAAALLTLAFTSTTAVLAQVPVAIGDGQSIPSLAPLLRGVTPSVVSIAIRRRMTDEEMTLFSDPRNPPVTAADRNIYASGSGVIIDSDQGFIVTGSHVVDGADEILVILSDGRRLAAKVVGSDPDTDIAVVRIGVSGLRSIKLGDSNAVQVGDFVLSIGNPFSIGQTVTSGIVSALRRRSWGDQNYEDFIQTDAAINLGSSGGALVNLRGELIGMNAAILDTGDPMGGYVGIGFAIPVNTVRSIAGQLIKYGSVSHGHLGVVAAGSADDVFQQSTAANSSGVVIAKIDPGSSAEHAGLRVGDKITTLNSSPISDAIDLQVKTAMLRVGDIVELNIIRDGQALTIRATLNAKSKKAARKEGPPGAPFSAAVAADH